MTNLTYTIIHVQVTAKEYWKEEKGFARGFVSNDFQLLFLPSITVGLNEIEICLNKKDSNYVNKSGNMLSLNRSHSLSDLANKLGAKIYGGFEDEKDFYLLLETRKDFNTGDIYYYETTYNERYPDEIIYPDTVYSKHYNLIYDVAYLGPDDMKRAVFKCFQSRFFVKNNEFQQGGMLHSRLHLENKYQEYKGNIFQEYARTGIIENDLYKQFFK